MMMKLENFNHKNQKFQAIYEQISDLQTFRQKIISNEEELKDYLKLNIAMKNKNTQNIINEINPCMKIMKSINTENSSQLKQKILNSIRQINFFNGNKGEVQEMKQKENEQKIDMIDNNSQQSTRSQNDHELSITKSLQEINTDIKNLFPGKVCQNFIGYVYEVVEFDKAINGKILQFIQGRVADENANIKFDIKKPKNLEIQSGKVYYFSRVQNKVNDEGYHYIDISRLRKILLSSDVIQKPNLSKQNEVDRSSIEYIKKQIIQ